MKYEVKYERYPVWRGRSENAVYTLHRAAVTTEGESVEHTGYLLWWMGSSETDTAECYIDGALDPGNGIYGGLISTAKATTEQLPPPNRQDLEQFDQKFRNLCEAENDPLLESRILV